MKARLILIPIDDICELFKDYTHLTGFPEDAQCDTLLFNKAEGKMCLRVTADSLNGQERAEVISFDLQRSHMVS